MSQLDRDIWRVVVAQGAAGQTEIVAAAPGQKHSVIGFLLSGDAAGTAQFESANNDLTGAMPITASVPFGFKASEEEPFVITVAGEALNLTSGTAKLFGVVYGKTEGA
jgi:hypothetical protein